MLARKRTTDVADGMRKSAGLRGKILTRRQYQILTPREILANMVVASIPFYNWISSCDRSADEQTVERERQATSELK